MSMQMMINKFTPSLVLLYSEASQGSSEGYMGRIPLPSQEGKNNKKVTYYRCRYYQYLFFFLQNLNEPGGRR